MRVATLDDDESQLELTKYTLKAIGCECHTFTTGKSLMRSLARETYDLFVVDWNLPDSSGPEVVKWIRQHVTERVPILFLTARQDEAAIIEGLSVGADDFMTKPMRVGELTARVRALIRRAYVRQDAEQERFGPYCFDVSTGTVELNGEPISLKPREFLLALFLFRNLGRLLSRAHLLEKVWGPAGNDVADSLSRSLDTHISRIRSQMRLRPEQGFRLSSVYGQGYRLEAVAQSATLRAS